MREKFGVRARMINVDGTGHGIYPGTDSSRTLNLTTNYLTTGQIPKPNTSCGARGH